MHGPTYWFLFHYKASYTGFESLQALMSWSRLVHAFTAYMINVLQAFKSQNEGMVHKAFVVSNKRSGVQITCMWLHAWTYLNDYSTVSTISRFWLHLIKILILYFTMW